MPDGACKERIEALRTDAADHRCNDATFNGRSFRRRPTSVRQTRDEHPLRAFECASSSSVGADNVHVAFLIDE
jgi:hypothetical protein